MKTHPTPRPAFTPISACLVASLVCLAIAPFARASAGPYVPAPAAPVISEQPAGISLNQGESFTLGVTASAYPAPGYQWMKNGVNVPGAYSEQLTVPNAQPADSGTYTVVVSNKVGRVTSEPVRVTVVATQLPLVLRAPVNQTVPRGGTARFELQAAGSPAPAYQWRKDGRNLPGATTPVLTLADVQPSDEGSYDVYLSNTRGAVLSPAATLHVIDAPAPVVSTLPPAAAPTVSPAAATRILVPPAHTGVRAGEAAALVVTAAGENLTFQWKRNGATLPGATTPTFAIPAASPADVGFYSVVVSGRLGTVESATAILAVSAGGTSRLINLSTRGRVPVGGALTPGFTWSGPGPKTVLVRAVGPTLARFGVSGALADPWLEIFPADSTRPTFANNNWALPTTPSPLIAASAACGAFALDAGSADSAVLASLSRDSSRSHTARITAADSVSAGVALAEVYDTDAFTSSSRLTSVSVLGLTGSGDSVLTAGFTLAGSAPKRVLLRAVGPGLAAFGVVETLPDPRLIVHAAGVVAPIARNDGWNNSTHVAAASVEAGAFALAPGSKDAAIVLTLPPGCYTVTASSANEISGEVLIEIYDLDS